MELIDAIKSRRSIRKYLDSPVEFEKVGVILEAARNAPSAGNVQDWKFIIVTEFETRKQIADACLQQYWMESAPVHIVVCAQPEKSERFYGERGKTLYSIQNSAAAIENMLLMASDQGLGSCWVSAFDADMLRTTVGIPENVIPQAVITAGYADEVPPSPQKLALENVVFIEKWGNRIRDMATYMEYYSAHVQNAVKKGKKLVQKIIETAKK